MFQNITMSLLNFVRILGFYLSWFAPHINDAEIAQREQQILIFG